MEKNSNYKIGALKRKVAKDFQPGELISKMNESIRVSKEITNNQPLSKEQVAIRGLI